MSNRWTARIALVAGVIAAATSVASMAALARSQSTGTSVAPTCCTASHDA
jgi:hypothetical protein